MTSALARKLVFLALMPGVLPAQRYNFKLYGQDDGLTNLDVQCLMQDRAGFLWVGTDGGAFRYDGHQFRGFTTAEGLPSVQVKSLHQSPDGTIWVGTMEGLARFRGNAFEKIPIVAPGIVEVTSDARNSLYVSSESGLWVGRPVDSNIGHRFRLYAAERGAKISGLTVDSGGGVWLGCGGSICTFANDRIRILRDMGVPFAVWGSLLFDKHGSLWARSGQHLIELPSGANRFVARDEGLPFATRKPSIKMDSAGEIYVPTWQGLAHRTPHGWDLIRRANGLPISQTGAFLEDREGSAWIALDGGGIVRWLGYKKWETFTESEGLSHDVVWGMTRDKRGRLWAATQAGMSRYSPESHQWKALKHPLLDMTPSLAVVSDRDGTLWIAQAPGGVVHLDPVAGRIERYDKQAGLSEEWAYSLAFDGTGDLWVTTSRGMYRGHRAEGVLRFKKVPLPLPRASGSIGFVMADSHGRVWTTTLGGVCYWEDETWRTITAKDGLRRDEAEFLAEAPDHSIWVTYRDLNGLSRLEFSGHHVTASNVDPPAGRGPTRNYFLKFDRRGWLWLGTDTGLNRYDGRSWTHYDRADGMPIGDCDLNAFYDHDDGSIWVGTSRGLAHLVTLEASQARSPEIRPVLTSLKLGGLAAALDGKESVPYERRSLDVTFTALTFLKEESVSFRHRLLGLDESWTETSQREAHYPGLPPGRYRLQVQATTDRRTWLGDIAEIPFTVKAPWWQQWWARLAGLGLVVLSLRQLWRWRLRAILRRQQELERAVADRTQKLAQEHDVAIQEKARAESEREKVEKQKVEIERLLWESRQAERVKGEFVTNMSHEVRTPLNTIIGMTDLMLHSQVSEDLAESLRAMKSSSASLLALVNGVLDFSHAEGGQLTLEHAEFDVPTLVQDALNAAVEETRRKGLQIRMRLSPNLPPRLIGDAARLHQVLVNLVDNAVKFTARGFVELLARADSISDEQAVLHVEVRDTGIGIPPEQTRLIFEPFRQADGSYSRRYGGTGLGLAMCSRLVWLMDGRIWVESTPSVGSTFHFTARLGVPAEPNPASKGRLASPATGSRFHILLVEDNLVNQKLARKLLENSGHTVTCAADGRQALEACDTSTFDVILMDVQMPVMDGFEATAELRNREKRLGRHTPVVALTANAMQGDRERCITAGMDGYVTKPINTKELLEAIADVVRNRCKTESYGPSATAAFGSSGSNPGTIRRQEPVCDTFAD